ncbi:hypothetical protein [Deinococcus frigens]|uniref:hypothetical protein n=1 Tax=Deinococcus frigens TaxID=249403 RepID=UPI0004960E0C|nr:hypothetical protein [Deinococcus frigens]
MELRPLTSADLSAAAQAFTLTFNATPWNETWTLQSASVCLSDLLMVPRAACLEEAFYVEFGFRRARRQIMLVRP